MSAPNVRSAFSVSASGDLKEKNYSPYMRDGQATCAVLDGDFRPMKQSDYAAANKKFGMLGQNHQAIYADNLRDPKDPKRKGLYDKLSADGKSEYQKGLDEVKLAGHGTDANAVKDKLAGGNKGREQVWSVGGRPVMDSLMGDVSVVSFNEGANLYTAGRMAGAYSEKDTRYGVSALAREAKIDPAVAADKINSPTAQKFRSQQGKPGGASL